jgi:hypothetical protein
MTYKDLFVAEVKLNGKILRVRDNNVYLPFGSEYSLLLKNLNSRRASVNITIDGEDVLDNSSLILEPNGETELEGFLRGSTARNRFRFINKTKEIQEHRGDKAGDGLIRIEFAFEKPQLEPQIKNVIKEVHHHYNPPWTFTYHSNDLGWETFDSFSSGGTDGSKTGKHEGSTTVNCCAAAAPCSGESVAEGSVMRSLSVEADSLPAVEEGITVKGSECNQNFHYTSVGQLEASKVIVIQLKGLTESGGDIKDPITVQKKLVCSSCGKSSTSSFKFCPNCGTFLE